MGALYSRSGEASNRARLLIYDGSHPQGNEGGFRSPRQLRGDRKRQCGILGNNGVLTVNNSTFTGNIAGNDGGGIHTENGTLNASNSTFAGNNAPCSYGLCGGGIYSTYGTVTLKNTIVANSPSGDNCYGTITDGGGNLNYPNTIQTACPGINSDPKLGPLQHNGGPTHTMALLPGSAAIDAGINSICAAAPVNNLDQRGIARPQGLHCDSGAYEALLPRAFLPIIMR
jgi:predicted outer membrane repeat protein